jgi:hypothetical protein
MALSAFDDKGSPPQPEELMTVLGTSGEWWAAFVRGVEQIAGAVEQRWTYSGPKYGWSMRLLRRDRVLTYLTPQPGRFLVGVVLGEKAVQAGLRADLRPAALKSIEDAPRYAEGRGVRVTVESASDMEVALQIAALKTVR